MNEEAIHEAELVSEPVLDGTATDAGAGGPVGSLASIVGRFQQGDRSGPYPALFMASILILAGVSVLFFFKDDDEGPDIVDDPIYDPDTPGRDNVAMHTHPDNQNEMSVAINPVNPLNMVAGANDYGCNEGYEDAWAGYYYTNDGGETWDSGCIPGYPGDISPEGQILAGYFSAGDPVLAVDSNGRFFYAGIAFSRSPISPSDIFVAVSEDGGRTFGDIEIVSPPGSGMAVVFQDKEWIHVDPFNDNVYIAWAQFENYLRSRIMFARSTNGGANWELPYAISGWFDGQQQHQGTAIAVDGSGYVHVTWIDHASNHIVLKTSKDSGDSFEGALTTALPILDIDPIPPRRPAGQELSHAQPAPDGRRPLGRDL